MGILKPTAVKKRAVDLTPAFLSGLGVKAVLLDVDNTVASYTSHEPLEGTVEWARSLAEAGLRVIIVSNNFEHRVRPFAEKFGVDFISFAIKPLPFGYWRAKNRLQVSCKESIIIGDQIFTDVVGANLSGMKSVLLTPIEEEQGWTFRIRRICERGLRKKYLSGKDGIK